MTNLDHPTRHRLPRGARLAAVVATLVLPLSAAACTAGGDSSSPTPGAATSAPASSPTMASPSAGGTSSSPAGGAAGAGTEPFGPACASLPETGAGSAASMATQPVVDAASENQVLGTLVTAIKAAGLTDQLNNASQITVFAPTNTAFEQLPATELQKLLSDPAGSLTNVLSAHVVQGKLSPDQLAGTHQTLNGNAPITVTGSGVDYTVNDKAKVVCGNIQAANATIYLIDQVLVPGS